jgi:hypothetical protein
MTFTGASARWLLLPALLLLCVTVQAQSTVVKGRVTDAATGEGLPFVNIAFVDSKIGTTTDLEGNYSIDTYYATDSIRASFVGYVSKAFPVRRDRSQVIDMALEPSSVQLQEVVIRPSSENPAFAILRRVVQHKPANNREKLAAYQYEAYNKVEFDLNNITEEFTQKKLFKPFAFIFDHIDSTEAKPYLPIFMTETLSDVYYRQQPRTRKEHIKGTRVSGIENESVSQFMGDMYQNVNIYDNFLEIFGKNFVSPIADNGRNFYNYYLTDSAYVGRYWCYKIEFRPKRVQELAFQGEVWINDTTYAVRTLEAGIAEGANLNFVQSFHVRQEYDQVGNEIWMLVRDELVVDLNVLPGGKRERKDPVQGLYGRRTATYRDFVFNRLQEEQFYAGAEEVLVIPEQNSTAEEYWEQKRHVQLTAKEAAIYHMVDTMKTIPRFRTYIDIVNTVVTGYYPLGQIEVGPYFTTYSFNPVEGHRFRMGARTSSSFSKRVEYEGYAAYGTTDGVVKYGIGGRGFISKDPRLIAGFYYKHDMEQLGQSSNAFREDNILSSAFRRTPNDKLTMVDEYKAFIDREWFMGFSSRLTLVHRTLFPRGSLSYQRPLADMEPEFISSITTSEVIFNTRFAYKEKYVSGDFTRVSLGTRYPILEVQLVQGVKGLLEGDYQYSKPGVRVRQRIPLGPWGNLQYTVTGSQVFGTLPYPLLIIHSGNETFYYDDLAFNTMNFFEFISDRSASLFLEQHLEGLFFNRIPLFRRLKWREVLGAKVAFGSLSDRHRQEMELLPYMFDLNGGPYAEVSIGAENILRILRVDLVRRLTYLDHANAKPWAFRLKMNISF